MAVPATVCRPALDRIRIRQFDQMDLSAITDIQKSTRVCQPGATVIHFHTQNISIKFKGVASIGHQHTDMIKALDSITRHASLLKKMIRSLILCAAQCSGKGKPVTEHGS